MPKPRKLDVKSACDQSIDRLRAAQKKATPLQWRRLQHAISRLALTAGYITPVKKGKPAAKRKRKSRAKPKTDDASA